MSLLIYPYIFIAITGILQSDDIYGVIKSLLWPAMVIFKLATIVLEFGEIS